MGRFLHRAMKDFFQKIKSCYEKKKFFLITAISSLLALSLCFFSFRQPAPLYAIFSFSRAYSNGVFFNGLSLPVGIFLIFNYFLISSFGYLLLGKFFNNLKSVSFVLKLFSGFFVGYVSVIGVVRLVSLFVQYDNIYGPVWIIIGLISALYVVGCKKYKIFLSQKTFTFQEIFFKVFINIFQVCLMSAVIFIILILQINQGEFNWVGHGIAQYSYLLDRWIFQKLKYFPVIKQHCDELIFHYFLMNPFKSKVVQIVPWWITLGLIKMSAFSFVFICFKKLKISSFFAFIASGFMMIATFSLIAMKYYLLIASSCPIFYIVHSGQIVGICVTLLFILDALMRYTESKDTIPAFTYIMIGLGLGLTTLSNSLLIFLLLSFIQLFLFKRNKNGLLSGNMICLLSVGTTLLLYLLPFKGAIFYGLRTAFILGIVALLAIRAFRNVKGAHACGKINFNCFVEKKLRPYWFFLAATFISLLFLGNIFVENPMSKSVYRFLDGGSEEIKTLSALSRPLQDGEKVGDFMGGTLRIGDYRDLTSGSMHNRGIFGFASYFGGILMMILIVNFLYSSNISKISVSNFEYIFYEVFLLCVVLLPCLFFFMEFFDYGVRGWIKSRFLEIPLYCIVFVFLFFCGRFSTKVQKIFIVILLCFYMIVPFIATQRHKQIKENWNIFNVLVKIMGIPKEQLPMFKKMNQK